MEHAVNIQFKKGVLELCVLALLQKRDYYGYELVETLATEIEVAEGTIYPLLRRLNGDGYFETYLKESSQGPPRKYYRITLRGRETYQKLLSEWTDFQKRVDRVIIMEKKPQ